MLVTCEKNKNGINGRRARTLLQGISGPMRCFRGVMLLAAANLILSGCANLDINRIVYDFLRQEDCRRNDVDVYEFCSRTFVFEYDEYEQLRQEYLRSEQARIHKDQSATIIYPLLSPAAGDGT